MKPDIDSLVWEYWPKLNTRQTNGQHRMIASAKKYRYFEFNASTPELYRL